MSLCETCESIARVEGFNRFCKIAPSNPVLLEREFTRCDAYVERAWRNLDTAGMVERLRGQIPISRRSETNRHPGAEHGGVNTMTELNLRSSMQEDAPTGPPPDNGIDTPIHVPRYKFPLEILQVASDLNN